MDPSNARIADLLRQYAAALTLEGADRFKVKAYRRAADTLEALDQDVAKLVAEGSDLQRLPGIGAAISEKIQDIVKRGKLVQLEKSISNLKPELVELATRPALDPAKVLRVYKKLKINNLHDLRSRLKSGEIAEAFGARIAYHIRQGLAERPRMLLYDAEPISAEIKAYLESIPGVTRVSQVGSLRRKADTVGDLNFLVISKTAASTFKHFSKFRRVREAKRRAPNEMLFTLSSGAVVSIAWTKPATWGIELLQRTGSETHLDELHARAKKKSASRFRRKHSWRRALLRPKKNRSFTSLGCNSSNPSFEKVGVKLMRPHMADCPF